MARIAGVDLPKNNDEINYDHITDEKQIAILDVLLKQHITEKNYIEINFSPELLERTYNDFKSVKAAPPVSVAVSIPTTNTLFCLFLLSTTDKYDDDLRGRMQIDASDKEFIDKLVENYGNDPIINKYKYEMTVQDKYDFGFVSRLPVLTVLNIILILSDPYLKEEREMDLSAA